MPHFLIEGHFLKTKGGNDAKSMAASAAQAQAVARVLDESGAVDKRFYHTRGFGNTGVTNPIVIRMMDLAGLEEYVEWKCAEVCGGGAGGGGGAGIAEAGTAATGRELSVEQVKKMGADLGLSAADVQENLDILGTAKNVDDFSPLTVLPSQIARWL
jgi:hypothetical protein